MTARTLRIAMLTTAAACALWLAAPAANASWSVSPPVRATDTAFRNFDLKRIGGTLYAAVADDHNIYVYRIDQNGDWQFVNIPNKRPAGDPSLAEGPGGVPWLAWTEDDADGVSQIHAGYLDNGGFSWHEPDGRDWQINYRPPAGDPWHDDVAVWYAGSPRLVFLGDRPYITYLQDNPSEYEISAVRLANDGRSWDRIGSDLLTYIPRGPGAAVVDGLLNIGAVAGFDGAVAGRLSQAGAWESLGSPNTSVKDSYGNAADGPFERIAGFDGETHVLWSGSTGVRVSKPAGDGSWQTVGGGPVAPEGSGAAIREIGGRLYVAWVGSESVPELHVSRLADDGGSWIDVDGPVGHPVSGGAMLSALDGVPYVAFTESTGSGSALKVARLTDAPTAIGPDDDGSGPGEDPPVDAVPVLPPRDDPHPKPPPAVDDVCGPRIAGTAGADKLAGTPQSDTIRGAAGGDTLSGGARGDCLFGGYGADILFGGYGADTLFGGLGPDMLHGGPGADRLNGGADEDRLYGEAGDDSLDGGADEDLLDGGPGNDRLHGGAGWDDFRAGPGDDTIDSADGRGESVRCGRGNDRVRADRFDRLRGCEHVTLAH